MIATQADLAAYDRETTQIVRDALNRSMARMVEMNAAIIKLIPDTDGFAQVSADLGPLREFNQTYRTQGVG